MTDQESSSSDLPASTSESSSTHRYTLLAAVGIMGTEEDCARFRDLMVADFENRCKRANDKIFQGRITLLPVEETIEPDAQV